MRTGRSISTFGRVVGTFGRDLWTGTTERDARASGARPAPKVGEARQEDEEDDVDVDGGSGSDSTRLDFLDSVALSLAKEREGWLAP